MEILELAVLVSLASVINCKEQTLTAETGNFSSNSTGDHLFKIRVPKGKLIAISVDHLKLNKYSSLTIRDGLYGNGHVYTTFGERIYKTREDDSSDYAVAIPPIAIRTKTRKLLIFHEAVNVGDGEGFSARYTSYTELGTCSKEELQGAYDDATITCDTDPLSPVASQCEVSLQCGEAYQQYSETELCGTEGWEGNIQCQPKSDFIEKCSYDFDEFTTDEGCPFSINEVVQYYAEVEDAGVFGSSLGRSRGKRNINCRQSCAHDGFGRRIQRCNRQMKINFPTRYFYCLVCRMMYRCSRNNVVF